MKLSRLVIPAERVNSLTWRGDALVDWVGGGEVFHLDGKREDPQVAWRYRFDAAQATPDGHFAVIYERQGTKALLLREGKLLRELNRSFYYADLYEYPVCLWQRADGRTLLAHCPERYCRIDIEDAESGARLTEGIREPSDFFHSRLRVNPAGTRLLSAGWVWSPLDGVVYFDVAEALRNPTHLDRGDHAPGSFNMSFAEESSACWQTNDRVLLGGSSENDPRPDEEQEDIGEPRLHARGIAVYDVVSGKYIRSVVIGEAPGTMMPVGESHVVCFRGHPKLASLDTGEVVARWEDLDTGHQVSSLLMPDLLIPPLALDPERQRFAVHGPDGITVVQIDLSE